jgi:6-phosphogluconolactonase (cycloisomerase 2 family)
MEMYAKLALILFFVASIGESISKKKDCRTIPSTFCGNIQTYRIHGDGSLTPLQCTNAGINPVAVAASPDGSHVAVANAGSNDVTVFSVNCLTGVLTKTQTIPLPGEPIAKRGLVATTPPPNPVIVFKSDGTLAASTNPVANTVTLYTVSNSGQWKAVQTVPSGGTNPTSLAFANAGALAVGHLDGTLTVFPITDLMLGSPSTCTSVFDQIDSVAFPYNTCTLLAATSTAGDGIAIYRLNNDLTIDCTSPTAPAQIFAITAPSFITFSPSTNHAFIVNGTNGNVISEVIVSPNDCMIQSTGNTTTQPNAISSLTVPTTVISNCTLILNTSLSSPNLSASVNSSCASAGGITPVSSVNLPTNSNPIASAAAGGVLAIAFNIP